MKYYKISRFELSFLNRKTSHLEETHITTFKIKPVCSSPENVLQTIYDKVNEAVDNDKRDMVLRVSTSNGRFIFNSIRMKKQFNH